MRGSLLGYDPARGEGVIAAEDGERYRFSGIEWQGQLNNAVAGTAVDFLPTADGNAAEVFPVINPDSARVHLTGSNYQLSLPKSPVVAGLLAFFFGSLGVHKFYLGYNAQGVILLVSWLVSWALVIVVIGIFGLLAIGVIAFIEFIIYISKSPEEFNRIYVEGHRPWF